MVKKNVPALKPSRRRGGSLRQKPALKALPFSRMIPNMTTLMALCMGLSAIRFAMVERYELSVILILVAGILDAMDGRLARMLGAASPFGAELDSLSDIVSFGVAPAVVLYIYALSYFEGFGWALCLFYAMCGALRLARFNISNSVADDSSTELNEWKKRFFTGIPIPGGAYIALIPMMAHLEFGVRWFASPFLQAIFLFLAAILMVSRVPTFSLKGSQIPQHWVLPLMICVGISVIALINALWTTLVLVGLAYLGSIPFSYRMYQKRLKEEVKDVSG